MSLEKARIRNRVKGYVVCKDCGRCAGDSSCYRLSDPVAVWDLLPQGFSSFQYNKIIGEKFAIPYQILPPDKTPTQVDYGLNCQVGWKGELANHCCQVSDYHQIHVREGDGPFPFTAHLENRSDKKANILTKLGHLGDWYSGRAKKMRERHRLFSSAYESPVNLEI